ncbi:MAG TPA: hypothetical protein EYG57_19410 [Planctomycetes bacterium]|nr:hypothetical protein [Planctomycetota bacterium]
MSQRVERRLGRLLDRSINASRRARLACWLLDIASAFAASIRTPWSSSDNRPMISLSTSATAFIAIVICKARRRLIRLRLINSSFSFRMQSGAAVRTSLLPQTTDLWLK